MQRVKHQRIKIVETIKKLIKDREDETNKDNT
jgi:hypothetical protein